MAKAKTYTVTLTCRSCGSTHSAQNSTPQDVTLSTCPECSSVNTFKVPVVQTGAPKAEVMLATMAERERWESNR